MKYDAWSRLTMPLYCEIYVNFTYSVNAISNFFLYLTTVYETLKRYMRL